MKKYNKFSIIFLIMISVIVSSCIFNNKGDASTNLTSVTSNTSIISPIPTHKPKISILISQCEKSGGEWKLFTNSCGDSCKLVRNSTSTMCGAVMANNCDCGANQCWNSVDMVCEDN